MNPIEVCSISSKGIRPSNEDAYLVSHISVPSGEFTLLSVADGLGGHPAGEVASQLAVRTMERVVKEELAHVTSPDPQSLTRLMDFAFEQTNRTIIRESDANPGWNGMATTLVSALISPEGECVIGNVGDSRAYRIDGRIERVTKDHSRVQELVDEGILTPGEAEKHPMKNLVTKIIGREGDSADILASSLGPSVLLLCSDGLMDGLCDDEILAIASETEFPDLCFRLLGKASWESRDNITIIAARRAQR